LFRSDIYFADTLASRPARVGMQFDFHAISYLGYVNLPDVKSSRGGGEVTAEQIRFRGTRSCRAHRSAGFAVRLRCVAGV